MPKKFVCLTQCIIETTKINSLKTFWKGIKLFDIQNSNNIKIPPFHKAQTETNIFSLCRYALLCRFVPLKFGFSQREIPERDKIHFNLYTACKINRFFVNCKFIGWNNQPERVTKLKNILALQECEHLNHTDSI